MGSPNAGVIQICVQCDMSSNQSSLSAFRHLNDLTDLVAGALCEHQLPATWALSTFSTEAKSSILRDGLHHQEIGLLAAPSWCSPSVSRKTLMSELDRNLDLFRKHDVHVRTLVLTERDIDEHLDLVSKAGIEIVRRPVDVHIHRRRRSTANPRHGMLMVTPSAVLPGRPGLLVRWDRAYNAKRCVWNSLSQRSVQHVVIDLGKLVAMPKSRVRQLQRWLRLVARLKDAGRLEIELARQIASRRCPTSRKTAQHSILNAAA